MLVNLMDAFFNFAMMSIMLIAVSLPFLENFIQRRNQKIRAECLLIANSHRWISIEEIAGLVGVSNRTAIKHIEWGINERIIIGNLENNMFERQRERTHEEVSFSIPFEPDDS